MSITVEGIVGNGRVGLADGSDNELRLGRNGELVTLQGGPDYWENLIRGATFMASTGTAGIAPGTALSTSPPFVLYNPPNSGIVVGVLDAEVGFVSGTLGAGNIVLAQISGQSLTSLGTILTPSTSNLIGASVMPQAKALQAPTLSATPTLMKNLWYTGAFVTNTTQYMGQAVKEFKGMVGLLPGGAICMQEVGAAGTTPLVMFSMSWVEIPMNTFNR
ncbi:MAG TPA: hypothetical protein VHD33_00660 [Legionellaceae bacterium]|nr:hypothetical protein [Legionellaceae bacterium]